MSLHSQAKAFLDVIRASSKVPFHELGAAKAREQYECRPKEWAPEWVPMSSVDDLMIDSADHSIPLRIYRPYKTGQSLPILVFYHGGGMVIGTLDGYDSLCRQLAKQSGSMIVSVDYRLAPEYKFPSAVEDAFTALKWVFSEAENWGGDPQAVGVAGDSAGGTLAAVVAILARDSEELQQYSELKFQLLIYPATAPMADSNSQYRCAEGFFLERPTILWFHESYIRSEEDRQDFRYAPLIAENHSGLPPTLVLVAGYDPLRDEGVAYAERLQKSGVDVELLEYPDMFHPFVSLAGILDEGRKAITDCAQRVKKYLSVAGQA